MKTEYLEILGAILLCAGAAALLNTLNNRRKKAIMRRLYSYSNVPKFIENQLNSTHRYSK